MLQFVQNVGVNLCKAPFLTCMHTHVCDVETMYVTERLFIVTRTYTISIKTKINMLSNLKSRDGRVRIPRAVSCSVADLKDCLQSFLNLYVYFHSCKSTNIWLRTGQYPCNPPPVASTPSFIFQLYNFDPAFITISINNQAIKRLFTAPRQLGSKRVGNGNTFHLPLGAVCVFFVWSGKVKSYTTDRDRIKWMVPYVVNTTRSREEDLSINFTLCLLHSFQLQSISSVYCLNQYQYSGYLLHFINLKWEAFSWHFTVLWIKKKSSMLSFTKIVLITFWHL